jgi:2-haloacid dehalogenase
VLGAELARDYKPQPIVYTSACRALGLAPAQVMMVACHSNDLAAAAAAGLQCGFIARPHEGGPGVGETQAACAVQAQAGNLLQLAQALLAL